MAPRRIDAGEAIRYGWETTKANLNQLLVLMIVAALATGIPSSAGQALERSGNTGLAFLLRLAGFVLSMLVGIGALRISLRLHDGQPVSLNDLFSADWSLFWRYALASILYGLVVAVGMVFLIVPGIILAVRYLFYGYFVLERDARPVRAMEQSSAVTEGARWDLFILGLLLILLNILGALLLGIGLLVTVPISFLATARVYRILSGGTAPAAAPAPAPSH